MTVIIGSVKVYEKRFNHLGIWTVTDSTNPQRFLLYDNHEDKPERRVILFMTDDHLRILMTTNRVHMESSAPVPPALFAQLYLIQVSFFVAHSPVSLVTRLIFGRWFEGRV